MIDDIFKYNMMLVVSYLFYYNFARKFNLKSKKKDNKHVIDILNLLFFGSFIYFNKYNNLDNKYYLMSFINVFLIGLFLEIPGMNTSINKLNQWRDNKITLILAFLTILIYKNNNQNMDIENIFLLIFLLIVIYGNCLVYYREKYINKKKINFHPHHWQIFWFLTLYFKINNYSSFILSTIYFSLFIHGITAYSPSSILKD